jgi:hypothetical protein
MVLQPVNKLPARFATGSFITVFTTPCHFSHSRASHIHSTPLHSISLGPILILSSNLRLSFPGCLFQIVSLNSVRVSLLPHKCHTLHPIYPPGLDHATDTGCLRVVIIVVTAVVKRLCLGTLTYTS